MNSKKNVEVRSKNLFWITPLLICLVIQNITSNSGSECDTKLLQSFSLAGLKTPSYNSMHICPQVQSKCCSLVDEITIVQSWKRIAMVNIKRRADQVARSWWRLTDYHEQLRELDRSDITVHYMSWRWVPYIHRMCDQTYISQTNSEKNEAFLGVNNVESSLPGVGKVRKHNFQFKADYLDTIARPAYMKKLLEIYKATLSAVVVKFGKPRVLKISHF